MVAKQHNKWMHSSDLITQGLLKCSKQHVVCRVRVPHTHFIFAPHERHAATCSLGGEYLLLCQMGLVSTAPSSLCVRLVSTLKKKKTAVLPASLLPALYILADIFFLRPFHIVCNSWNRWIVDYKTCYVISRALSTSCTTDVTDFLLYIILHHGTPFTPWHTNSSRYVFTKVTDLFDHLLQNTSLLHTAHYRQLVLPNAWNGQPLTSLCTFCLIIMFGQLLYHSSVLPLIPPTMTQLATRLSTFYSTANHHVFWHSFFKKKKKKKITF